MRLAAGRLRRAVSRARSLAPGRGPASPATPGRGPAPPATPGRGPASPATPGLVVGYDPKDDGRADPGEVVWAWVAYEEDASRGKDRPVLVVGRDGADVIALMLTSQDHDGREARDAARGEQWMDVGAGGWDAQRRPSEVRLDRVLRLRADAVRREGAALDRARFDAVVAAARALHGWSGVASRPPPWFRRLASREPVGGAAGSDLIRADRDAR